MSRRTTEPSERVTEILDESRDPRPLELPSTLAGGRYGVSRQAVIGVALVVGLLGGTSTNEVTPGAIVASDNNARFCGVGQHGTRCLTGLLLAQESVGLIQLLFQCAKQFIVNKASLIYRLHYQSA